MSVVNAVHWIHRDLLGNEAPTTGFLNAFSTVAEAQDFEDVLAPLTAAAVARQTLERFMTEEDDVGDPEDPPFGLNTLRAFVVFEKSDATTFFFSFPAPVEAIFAPSGELDPGNPDVANWVAFMLTDGRAPDGLTLIDVLASGSFDATTGVFGLALAGRVLRKSKWDGRFGNRQGIRVRI